MLLYPSYRRLTHKLRLSQFPFSYYEIKVSWVEELSSVTFRG